MPRPPSTAVRRAGATVLGGLLALTAAACSSDDASVPRAGPDSSAPGSATVDDPAAEPVATAATIGTVTGRLGRERRTKLVRRIATTVDEWVDAAYADGPYPRANFDDAFAIFTAGAAKRAVADAALMSNAGLGAGVDGVEMLNRTLTVDILAVDGAAAGVTARIGLGMQISGRTDRRERVTGSLFMTYSGHAWHVFGYQMDRGEIR